MRVMNYKDIVVSEDDDFLYARLLDLFNQIKLTQGGPNLDATLRRHNQLKMYAMKKQIEKIKQIELTYFNPDGSINQSAVENYHRQHQDSSLQKVKVRVY